MQNCALYFPYLNNWFNTSQLLNGNNTTLSALLEKSEANSCGPSVTLAWPSRLKNEKIQLHSQHIKFLMLYLPFLMHLCAFEYTSTGFYGYSILKYFNSGQLTLSELKKDIKACCNRFWLLLWSLSHPFYSPITSFQTEE